MEAIKSMNGTIWIFAAILIGMVLVQSALFLRLALNFNKKTQAVTKEEISQAAKTGAVAAVAPAFSTITIALSLIAMVGSATTFMRCGVIGAPSWELMMADLCGQTLGVQLGSAEFTQAAFTLCIFGMTLASAPYFINTILTLKPLDMAVNKSKENAGKRSFTPYLSTAAMAGLLGYMIMDRLGSLVQIIAVLSAAVTTIVIGKVAKKTGNKTLASFNMAIAMIVAMAVGQTLTVIMG